MSPHAHTASARGPRDQNSRFANNLSLKTSDAVGLTDQFVGCPPARGSRRAQLHRVEQKKAVRLGAPTAADLRSPPLRAQRNARPQRRGRSAPLLCPSALHGTTELKDRGEVRNRGADAEIGNGSEYVPARLQSSGAPTRDFKSPHPSALLSSPEASAQLVPVQPSAGSSLDGSRGPLARPLSPGVSPRKARRADFGPLEST